MVTQLRWMADAGQARVACVCGVTFIAVLLSSLTCLRADDEQMPPRNARDAFDAATAYAVPLNNIKIDGKLNDWPQGLPRYPIFNEFQVYGPGRGDAVHLEANDDLDAYFTVGYNAKAGLVYVAVVVRDDQSVVNWGADGTDAVEVYLDGMAREEQNRQCQWRQPSQYVAAAGDGGYIGRNGEQVNPSHNLGQSLPEQASFAHSRIDKTTIYEFALPCFDLFPNEITALKPGKRLGFDVVVIDKDRPAFTRPKWVVWGASTGYKFINAASLGDLVLLGDVNELLSISGIARDGPAGNPAPGALLEFWRGKEPAGYVQTDKIGAFRVYLPSGKYEGRVSIGQGVATTQPSKLEVSQAAPATWNPVAAPLQLPELLERTIDHYAAIKTYGDHCDMQLSVMGNRAAQSGCPMDVLLQRGAGLRVSSDLPNLALVSIVSDAKSVAMVSELQGHSMAPMTLSPPLSFGAVAKLTEQLAAPWAQRAWMLPRFVGTGSYPHRLVMSPDARRELRYRLESAQSLGHHELDDQKLTVIELVKPLSALAAGSHPLHLVNESARLQLWINEKDHLIQQTILIVPQSAGDPLSGRGDRDPMIFTTRHSAIRIDKPIDPSQFAMPGEK